MKRFINSVVSLHKDETGQGLVEYVLILALIALSTVSAMRVVATSIRSAFSKIGSVISSSIS